MEASNNQAMVADIELAKSDIRRHREELKRLIASVDEQIAAERCNMSVEEYRKAKRHVFICGTYFTAFLIGLFIGFIFG